MLHDGSAAVEAEDVLEQQVRSSSPSARIDPSSGGLRCPFTESVQHLNATLRGHLDAVGLPQPLPRDATSPANTIDPDLVAAVFVNILCSLQDTRQERDNLLVQQQRDNRLIANLQSQLRCAHDELFAVGQLENEQESGTEESGHCSPNLSRGDLLAQLDKKDKLITNLQRQLGCACAHDELVFAVAQLENEESGTVESCSPNLSRGDLFVQLDKKDKSIANLRTQLLFTIAHLENEEAGTEESGHCSPLNLSRGDLLVQLDKKDKYITNLQRQLGYAHDEVFAVAPLENEESSTEESDEDCNLSRGERAIRNIARHQEEGRANDLLATGAGHDVVSRSVPGNAGARPGGHRRRGRKKSSPVQVRPSRRNGAPGLGSSRGTSLASNSKDVSDEGENVSDEEYESALSSSGDEHCLPPATNNSGANTPTPCYQLNLPTEIVRPAVCFGASMPPPNKRTAVLPVPGEEQKDHSFPGTSSRLLSPEGEEVSSEKRPTYDPTNLLPLLGTTVPTHWNLVHSEGSILQNPDSIVGQLRGSLSRFLFSSLMRCLSSGICRARQSLTLKPPTSTSGWRLEKEKYTEVFWPVIQGMVETFDLNSHVLQYKKTMTGCCRTRCGWAYAVQESCPLIQEEASAAATSFPAEEQPIGIMFETHCASAHLVTVSVHLFGKDHVPRVPGQIGLDHDRDELMFVDHAYAVTK